MFVEIELGSYQLLNASIAGNWNRDLFCPDPNAHPVGNAIFILKYEK